MLQAVERLKADGVIADLRWGGLALTAAGRGLVGRVTDAGVNIKLEAGATFLEAGAILHRTPGRDRRAQLWQWAAPRPERGR